MNDIEVSSDVSFRQRPSMGSFTPHQLPYIKRNLSPADIKRITSRVMDKNYGAFSKIATRRNTIDPGSLALTATRSHYRNFGQVQPSEI